MSSPTIIRHRVIDNKAIVLTAVFDNQEQRILYYLQSYKVGQAEDRTGLDESEVWTFEDEAVEMFDRRIDAYQDDHIRQMCGFNPALEENL